MIDVVLKHLAASVENYETLKKELTPKQAEGLSTEVVRLTVYRSEPVD